MIIRLALASPGSGYQKHLSKILTNSGEAVYEIRVFARKADLTEALQTEEYDAVLIEASMFDAGLNFKNAKLFVYLAGEGEENPSEGIAPEDAGGNLKNKWAGRLFQKIKQENEELMSGAASDYPDICNINYSEINIIEDNPGQNNPQLKLVGNADVPERIDIAFAGNNFFSIGRFDINKNAKQSDFEFAGGITGISRRQAIIGKKTDDYYITRIGGAALLVNGIKMAAGASADIKPGDRISFGEIGAEYIFS